MTWEEEGRGAPEGRRLRGGESGRGAGRELRNPPHAGTGRWPWSCPASSSDTHTVPSHVLGNESGGGGRKAGQRRGLLAAEPPRRPARLTERRGPLEPLGAGPARAARPGVELPLAASSLRTPIGCSAGDTVVSGETRGDGGSWAPTRAGPVRSGRLCPVRAASCF